jgi:ribosomal protein L16 Arg81 hydroxylase
MPEREFDLSRLLDPIEPGAFFAEYWERKPLILSRKRPDYYAELLTLADVDHLLTATHLRRPAVGLVKDGLQVNSQKFANDLNWGREWVTGLADVDKLLDEYQAGATVMLQSLNRYWRPLALLCRNLERAFAFPVHANIYLTPKSAQGLAPHYDIQETLILQAAGSKHWRIYDSPVHLPHPGQPVDKKPPKGRPQFEFDLQAGDLLYMPRGYVHEALTSQTISLHITLAVAVSTWVEVLAEALPALREDPRFRKSLPVGFADEHKASDALRAEFKNLLVALPDLLDVDALLQRISDRFIASRPPILEGHLLELNDLDQLQADTRVRRREGVLYRLLQADGSLSLQYHGRKIQLSADWEPALHLILDGGDFSANMLPGKSKAREKLELVRRLVREGFLTPVADDTASEEG